MQTSQCANWCRLRLVVGTRGAGPARFVVTDLSLLDGQLDKTWRTLARQPPLFEAIRPAGTPIEAPAGRFDRVGFDRVGGDILQAAWLRALCVRHGPTRRHLLSFSVTCST